MKCTRPGKSSRYVGPVKGVQQPRCSFGTAPRPRGSPPDRLHLAPMPTSALPAGVPALPRCGEGYDTMVMLRLLFTSRKSRQSSSFSLTRRGTVRGRDPPPGLWGSPPGCGYPPHLISFWARSRRPCDRLWLAELRKSWRYTEQSCRFTVPTACSSLGRGTKGTRVWSVFSTKGTSPGAAGIPRHPVLTPGCSQARCGRRSCS